MPKPKLLDVVVAAKMIQFCEQEIIALRIDRAACLADNHRLAAWIQRLRIDQWKKRACKYRSIILRRDKREENGKSN